MNATDAVRQIVKQGDRSVATVFFFTFSRFEYALKRAGFVMGANQAEADWNAFAHAHLDLLQTDQTPEFIEAVDYLAKSPPKKQILDGGNLAWSDDKYHGKFDVERVLTLVRRIRNNLFHGGKFQHGVEAELSRDTKLLNTGLVVMQACLDADHTVHSYFIEGLHW